MTAPNPYPFDPAIVDRGARPPTPKERSPRMKSPMALDRDDRRALADLAGVLIAAALVAAGVLASLALLTLALALCWRLFLLVALS